MCYFIVTDSMFKINIPTLITLELLLLFIKIQFTTNAQKSSTEINARTHGHI